MRKPSNPDEEQPAFELAQLCRSFSELSPQPMIAVEGTTHIVRYVNKAFSRLVQKNRAELIGRPFAEAVPEGGSNGCIALCDRVYRTGTPEILAEQEHGHAPDNIYWSYSMWAILGANADPIGVAVQVTDTTEVALYRQQAVDMNQHLLVAASHQHELIEDAENANRIKDEFLSTLSHELRTPLTAMLGWADILADPRIDSLNASRAIEIIRRNAHMQVQLIDDLLDVSRIITGKLRLDMQLVELQSIARAAIDGLRPTAKTKEIALQLQLEANTGRITGDSDRLQQVVWNLVSNAIKFTPQGGHITIQIARVDHDIEMTVSDSGIGIAPEFLPQVFDRFRQADATTTRQFGGLGLGLSIVRQLVELHGGTVRVESEGQNRGATFTVNLPLSLSQSGENDDETLPSPTLSKYECLPEIVGLRVLVVDDEADNCELQQFILEGCGAQVKIALSAAAALKALAEETFDVLISDIGMPQEDGYSLIAKVHALARERGVKAPVAAALTAYVGEEDRIRVLQSGFQMHVPKPISPRELIAIVANLANRT